MPKWSSSDYFQLDVFENFEHKISNFEPGIFHMLQKLSFLQ